MTEWFEQWFGEEYLQLYPHRDDEDAARVVDRRISDDGRFVIKQIQPIGEERRFLERVRLYGPGELQDMLGRAGLTSRQVFGDYAGGALAESSPRAIFVAERG